MIPSQTFDNYPEFANAGTKTQPDSAKYSAGFVPSDTLPAEWLNWFLNGATKGITKLNDGVRSIEAEINGALTANSITPDASNNTQLQQLLSAVKTQAVNTANKACVCNTASTTAAKEVSVTGLTADLNTQLTILFTYGNVTQNHTPISLSVNGGAALAVKYYNNSGVLTDFKYDFPAGYILRVIFNGTNWIAQTRILYSAMSGSADRASQLDVGRYINGIKFWGTNDISDFGECTTAAATVAKTVSIATSSTYTNSNGTQICVLFKNGSTAYNPTLNVNNTVAYPLLWTTKTDGDSDNTFFVDYADSLPEGYAVKLTMVTVTLIVDSQPQSTKAWVVNGSKPITVDSLYNAASYNPIENRIAISAMMGFHTYDNTQTRNINVYGVGTTPISGMVVRVLFRNSQSNSTPKLSINGGSGIAIKAVKAGQLVAPAAHTGFWRGSSTSSSEVWQANTLLELMYDSTNSAWIIQGNPVLESYYSANTNYRVYADGFIEQWGNNSNQSDKNYYPLAVSYSNKNYWVFYLPQTGSGSDDDGDANDWQVLSKNESSFTGNSSSNTGGYWNTKGY